MQPCLQILLQNCCKPLVVMCVRRDVQVYELSSMHFLPKEWIMERWEDGFYITAMAGSAGGSSLVVMSKGTPYTQQSYKVRTQASQHCYSGVSRRNASHDDVYMLSCLGIAQYTCLPWSRSASCLFCPYILKVLAFQSDSGFCQGVSELTL